MLLAPWGGVNPWIVLTPDRPQRARYRGPGVRRRAQALAAGLLSGVLAAGLGLGALAVVVLFLWITSPYPDSGPEGALDIAAGLWLLAHGGDLLRTDTVGGAPAPIGVTPLLLTVLPVWLLNRAGAHAVETPEAEVDAEAVAGANQERDPVPVPAPRPIGAPATVAALVTGYCAVAAAAVVHICDGPIRSRPSAALVLVPLIAVLAAGSGAWCGCGRPGWHPPAALRRAAHRVPARLLAVLPWGGPSAVLRAATAGALVLVAGGALVTTASLIWHAPAANASFTGLTDALSGRFAILLLCGALLPNAAVWGAAYALTPGFAVGTGTAVAPTGTRYGPLPDFPLLAALPVQGGGGPLCWAALLVPVAAGAVTAVVVVRSTDSGLGELWTAAQTVAVAALSALGVGTLTAATAALASGPVGAGRLAEFGPGWQAVGIAALCWTAGICVPGVLLARRRHRHAGDADPVAGQPRSPAQGRSQSGISSLHDSRDFEVSASETQSK